MLDEHAIVTWIKWVKRVEWVEFGLFHEAMIATYVSSQNTSSHISNAQLAPDDPHWGSRIGHRPGPEAVDSTDLGEQKCRLRGRFGGYVS